ncbi:MAG: sugar transferase [Thermodesulfobacteriota bacterium]|nr:sugar transferase [Thermodesulfobacteriota bacterium]
MKRLFDFIATAAGLIVISPVLLFLFLLVRRKMDSPVFFRQKRPGRHGASFYMYKFRTMTDACDDNRH